MPTETPQENRERLERELAARTAMTEGFRMAAEAEADTPITAGLPKCLSDANRRVGLLEGLLAGVARCMENAIPFVDRMAAVEHGAGRTVQGHLTTLAADELRHDLRAIQEVLKDA